MNLIRGIYFLVVFGLLATATMANATAVNINGWGVNPAAFSLQETTKHCFTVKYSYEIVSVWENEDLIATIFREILVTPSFSIFGEKKLQFSATRGDLEYTPICISYAW